MTEITLKDKVQTNQPIQVWEIVTYWDSYVADLATNLGEEPTRGNLFDMMSDFGVFPNMEWAEIEKAINIALDVYFGCWRKS